MSERGTPDIASVISSITGDPEMMSKLRGAVIAARQSESDGEPVSESAEGASSLPDVAPRAGGPSWSASDRKKLLEALRPFLSEERREKADALINVMALLDSGLIDMIGKERR